MRRSQDLAGEIRAHAGPLADLLDVDPELARRFAADLERGRDEFGITMFGNFLSPGDDPDRDELREELRDEMLGHIVEVTRPVHGGVVFRVEPFVG